MMHTTAKVDARVAREALAKYRRIPSKRHSACRVCGTKLAAPVINLPAFPLTEIYVAAPVREKLAAVDQAVCLCEKCGHGQLRTAIAPEALYGHSYFTRTSDSGSAKTAIDVFLDFIEPLLPSGRLKGVLEIGCNDLYTLTKLSPRAEALCGIDPIWKGRALPEMPANVRVVGGFIEEVDLRSIDLDYDTVVCSHTLEHIDDPVRLLSRLVDAAPGGTRFFFQFPGLEPLVHDGRFDQIHQQHYNYFSLRSVRHALKRAGAELTAFRYNYDHWGALMIAFRKRARGVASPKPEGIAPRRVTAADMRDGYKLFRTTMAAMNEQIARLSSQREVSGYGAALMLPLLSYYLPALRRLARIIDDDPNKQGLYYINYPVKIVSAAEAGDLRDKSVVVTAINSKQNVRALTRKLIDLQARDILIPMNVI